MSSILTVCTGNVCRSPLIERLLQRGLDDAYGPGAVRVASAGTGALVGSPMDERSAAILTELGGSAEGFRGRRLERSMLSDVDLVLTATRKHRAAVVRTHPKALRRAFTTRELAHLVEDLDVAALPADPGERIRAVAEHAVARRGTNSLIDQDELDVVDPYRRADEVYAVMRAQLEPAVETVLGVLAPGR